MGCRKSPELSDETWRVIDWEFRIGYVGTVPSGYYTNYYAFRYTPTNPMEPCRWDSIVGYVCLRDVASDTIDGIDSCRYFGRDKQQTEIKIRPGSIREVSEGTSDCRCP